jgi:Omp85 superfamily domain
MIRCAAAAAGVSVLVLAPAALRAQPPAQAPVQQSQPAPIVRTITITGARELGEPRVRAELHARQGATLSEPPEDVARHLEELYREEGYTFARVTASFDQASGALAVSIDEGAIDGVEFSGVDEKLARTFAEEFAMRAGDIFNGRRARQALDVVLRQTRGAVRPGIAPQTITSTSDAGARRGSFDLVDRGGRRILIVELREPGARVRIIPDLGEREDWFTPVDGFVPSLGMGIAVFDHESFNHTFLAGHLSYKAASQRAGYALGFERPLFGRTKLFVGGELHDLTATDDRWQTSSFEASLDAMAVRRTFRDYYRRRGVQINAALRVHPRVEALFAWRGEREAPLAVASDFSLWRGDEAFRANAAAIDGRLNAIVVGASIDGRGFDRESLESSYRRHQLEEPFGVRLDDLEKGDEPAAMWRVDWTSEIAASGAFGGDFDFRRHVIVGRTRVAVSPHQVFAARAIGGWSDGVLPPQRIFSIGGIGSVHGYDFKAQSGDSVALLNLEYEVGWHRGFKAIGFFDAGRAATPAFDAPWLKGVGWGVGIDDFRVDFGYRTDAVPSSLQVLLRFSRSF